MISSCTCHWHKSSGLPCAHIVRVLVVIKELTNEKTELELTKSFYPYWLRKKGGWTGEHASIITESARESAEDPEIESEQAAEIRLDREAQTFWSNGHSSWNFMHRRARTKGIEALKKLDKVMDVLTMEVARVRGSDDSFNVVSLTRRLAAAVEFEYEPPTRPLLLTAENIATISNANPGNPSGRGTHKRARSYCENLPRGKRKRAIRTRTNTRNESTVIGSSQAAQSHAERITGSQRLSLIYKRALLKHMNEPPE